MQPPAEYQKEAMEFLFNRLFAKGKMGGGLFLDPGLGKTRITLELLDAAWHEYDIRKVLVIAPLRVVDNVWEQEIAKWNLNFSSHIIGGVPLAERMKRLRGSADIYLMNPELVKWLATLDGQKFLQSFDVVVFDESTKFKNWSAKRTQYLRKYLLPTQKRIALTGTPAPNGYGDVFPQIYLLDGGKCIGCKNLTQFRRKFMQPDPRYQRKFNRWLFRKDREKEFEQAIAPVVLRMSADEYLDLPLLVRNNVWVNLEPPTMKKYKSLERKLFFEMDNGKMLSATNASANYTACRGFANGGFYDTDPAGEQIFHVVHKEKIEALADLIDELGGKPVLVAFQYRHDLDRLLQHGNFKDAKFIRGNMNKRVVNDNIAEWNKGTIPVMFCQPSAMSHGLNLQFAGNDIIWFGLTDDLENYIQFNCRIHRQGVRKQVRVHHLLCKDTIEEALLVRTEAKDDSQKALLYSLQQYRNQQADYDLIGC